jgi:hypothetical protein
LSDIYRLDPEASIAETEASCCRSTPTASSRASPSSNDAGSADPEPGEPAAARCHGESRIAS